MNFYAVFSLKNKTKHKNRNLLKQFPGEKKMQPETQEARFRERFINPKPESKKSQFSSTEVCCCHK